MIRYDANFDADAPYQSLTLSVKRPFEAVTSLLRSNCKDSSLFKKVSTVLFLIQLFDRGYKNLVALEPSQGMVEQAKKKNVYKEFIMELVGKEPTSIKEGIFKFYFRSHWRIQGDGAPGTHPGGSNSFIFIQFSAKKLQNNTTLGVGVPLRKILDPPLEVDTSDMFVRKFCPICLSNGEISWSMLHPAGWTLTFA